MRSKYELLQAQDPGEPSQTNSKEKPATTDAAGADNSAQLQALEKANADLKNEVSKQEERCEELEKLLADQKAAYEVLLDTIREKETAEENAKEHTAELEQQLKALQEMNKEVH